MNRRVILGLVAAAAVLVTAPAAASAQHWDFTKLQPTTGGWGTTVYLRGLGFNKRTVQVYYGGTLVKPVRVRHNLIVVKVPEGAKSGWWEVSQGGRQLRAPVMFQVFNAPTATAIEPDGGPPGIWVTVRGRFFSRDTTFWLGRLPLRRRMVSPTEYKLLVHRGVKSGGLSLRYRGKRYPTKLRFRITQFPVLSGFAPAKGYFGDKITLRGASLCSNAKAYLGDTELKIVARRGTTALVVQLPQAAKTGSFSIECFGKRQTAGREFLVEPPYALVNQVVPAAGPAGQWIEVRGRGFRKSDKFWLGNRSAKVRYVTATSVKLFVPPGAPSAAIYFESYGKRFKSRSSYAVFRQPTITGINPPVAWYGQQITVRGRDFCPQAKVFLGPTPLTVLRREDTSGLVVTLPRGAKAQRIRVQCLKWTVASAQVLRIEVPKAGVRSMEPTLGPVGTDVTIRGFNLQPADHYYLGAVRLPANFKNATTVTAKIPRGARSGRLVHVSFGRRVPTEIRYVVGWPKPAITGFAPTSGWQGTKVLVQATKLCAQPRLLFGGRIVPTEKVETTGVRFVVPRGGRTGKLTLLCHNHRVTSTAAFQIVPPYAAVEKIEPAAGPWGTWITLTGKNFVKGNAFWIGWTRIQRVRYVSPTEVKLQLPPRAKGGHISVYTLGRKIQTAHKFELKFPTPTITRVTPSSGWWGDLITVEGKSFCAKPAVRLGAKYVQVLKSSTGELRFKIPRGAASGRVRIACFGQTGTSPKSLHLAKPYARIVDVFPDRGPPLKWLTITGHNVGRVAGLWLVHRKYGRCILTNRKTLGPTKLQAQVPAKCKGGALVVKTFDRTQTTSFNYFVPRQFRK